MTRVSRVRCKSAEASPKGGLKAGYDELDAQGKLILVL